MKIAMLGTRGVPAQYGGFETAVEEVGSRLAKAGHEVVVYCRNPGQTEREHLGMTLVNLPAIRRKQVETLSHTGLSVAHALLRGRPDVALVFNAANAPFVPTLRAARVPVAVHIDGLEWKRAKWSGMGKRYYRAAERWSVRLADEIVADARGIADHVRSTYGRESVVIAYGAPIVHGDDARLPELGISAAAYHLVVARFEPENHVDVIVRGYVDSSARLPLVIVGSAPYADGYEARVRDLAAGDPRVKFLGAVWDQDLLDQLYAGSASYLHGHSVGGTNPSLLRAMGAGAPVSAYDVVFNREVTNDQASYFTTPADVARVLLADEETTRSARARGEALQRYAETTYRWDDVAERYEELCQRLAGRR